MPAQATLSGTTIASANDVQFVEGNVYFPPSSINKSDDAAIKLTPTSHTTYCPWKGTAHYYNVSVKGEAPLANAAWYYPEPLEKANHIKDHVAFYTNKVKVERS